MASYKFVRPIQTGVFLTFDESCSEYLTVNFFNVDGHTGLLIDEQGNRREFDLSQLNIEWNMICSSFMLGRHCVDYIKQFYPGREVKFVTATTVSNDGSIEVEPDYFLFFGLN